MPHRGHFHWALGRSPKTNFTCICLLINKSTSLSYFLGFTTPFRVNLRTHDLPHFFLLTRDIFWASKALFSLKHLILKETPVQLKHLITLALFSLSLCRWNTLCVGLCWSIDGTPSANDSNERSPQFWVLWNPFMPWDSKSHLGVWETATNLKQLIRNLVRG